MENIKFRVEDYNWGTLRRIEVGSSRSIVIMPRDWENISNVISGTTKRSFFTEETGKKYVVLMSENTGGLVFKDGRGFVLMLSAETVYANFNIKEN